MRNYFSWIFKGKIRTTILVISLTLAIVPLSITLFSYYFNTRNALEDSAVHHLQGLANWEAKLVTDWFGDHARVVKLLSNSKQVLSGNKRDTLELLRQTQANYPEFRSLAFVDTSGKILVDTTGRVGIDVSDREYYKANIKGKNYISEMIMARTYHLPCIVFSSPVTYKGKIIGLLFGSVEVNHLNEIITGYGLGKTGENCLIDYKGNFIVIPHRLYFAQNGAREIVPAPKTEILTKGLKGQSGIMQYKDYSGVMVIGVSKWIPSLRAVLVTKQAINEALDEAGGKALNLSIFIGIFMILILLPIVYITARRISSPLESITKAVNEIASGNLNYRIADKRYNSEVSNLGQKINVMGNNLERSQQLITDQIAELETQNEEIIAQNEQLAEAYYKLEEANKHLEQLAITDQLTEIYNRRYLMDRLQSEILISLRSNRSLSIAILDIDHFKSVNDSYGHKAGDQVLKELVKIILKLIRKSDLVARFGGEEFIILTPDTDKEGATNLAEKICSEVEGHTFECDNGKLHITVSIGVATLANFKDSPDKIEDQLLTSADQHLYEAKRAGRNQVKA